MHNKKQNISKVTRKLISYFRDKERVGSQQEKDSVWSRIEDEVKSDPSDHKLRKLKYLISIAASAAVIAGACWILKDQLFTLDSDHIRNVANTSILDSEDVVLIVSDKKQFNIKSDSIVIYSKSGEILLQSETLDIDPDNKQSDKIEYNQVIVPKGKRIQLILSDASKIWVNSGTKVVYPRSFTGKYREIFVDGEVYLEVEHNKEAPFIVKTDKFDVQVLGTSFDICTYKGIESSVVLVNGLVNIKDHKGKKSELRPNQRIVINENGLGEKRTVDIYEYIGWINNLLVLNTRPLSEVFEKLHLYYGINFELEESVKDLPLSGKLDLKDNIEDIIKSISKTAPITYHTQNNKILIRKK